MTRCVRTLIALAALAAPAAAQTQQKTDPAEVAGAPAPAATPAPAPAKDPQIVLHERVTVVGGPELAAEIPGSAHFLGGRPLEQAKLGFDDVHRVLRPVPGLNIQEEEGFGRRPNIGMRGSGSERSSKITLMEDGVLIAPAPYAAPAAYYFPATGRMEGIEVRKGSSQIKYGPNTVGGALNLVSTGIPDAFRLRGRGALGQHGSGTAHVHAGDSYGRAGWLLETYQAGADGFKQLDGGGDTGFRLKDYLGKLRLNTGAGARTYQQLELKLGHTDETADETYLGLAEDDFRATPLRRYAASQLDRFESDHQQYQIRHFLAVPNRFDVTTTAWRNDFARNWYKLQSVLGGDPAAVLEEPSAFSDRMAVLQGADSAPNALVIRANNREYYSHGIQAVVGFDAHTAALRHSVEAGLRFTQDQEDRFQHDDAYQMAAGRMALTRAGAPGSNANRLSHAEAWAFFVEDRIAWGRLRLAPGLRYETIDLTRTDYAATDPGRTAPRPAVANAVDVWIPGLGVSLDLRPQLDAFAGVHRGFAPPGPGSTEQTEAEQAWNYELGLRAHAGAFRAELVGFYNDYENILGRDTLSTGGSGSGDLFNGGAVRASGLEALVGYDLRKPFGLESLSVPVRINYTLSRAEFRSSFASGFEPWGTVEAGDELPYLPRHQAFASVGLEARVWSLALDAHYVSRMRTVAGRGEILPTRATDAHLVVSASADYAVTSRARVFATVQNLTDRVYVVARQPAGARPGLPRTVMAGIKLGLGE